MTTDPAAFPACTGDARAYRLSVPATNNLTLTFKGVAPGRYAIALLHDENANGKADRALGMMPKEGFGFSRNAPIRMGPPKYGDAAFTVSAEDVRMAVKMRYLF